MQARRGVAPSLQQLQTYTTKVKMGGEGGV